MRLKQVIQEAAEFQMVVKDIESKMYELYRVLKKNSWQMTDESLETYLDSIFNDRGIGFTKGSKKGSHFSSLISGAGITEELFVVVEYVPGFSKYFKKFAKPGKEKFFFDVARNDFFRSVAEVVAHEYRHMFQAYVSGHKSMKSASRPEDLGYGSYYKVPEEIDAFALQAAVQQIRTGKSTIITQYYDYFAEEDPKVWQKFVKKTQKHIKDLKKRGMEKYIRVN